MNDDTISRKQAIDALEKGNWGVDWDKALAEAIIKDLPPAPFGTIKHAGLEHPLSDEEIIPRLREIRDQVGGSYAIDRAIELLTAQPEQCEDAVSRTEILRMINCINDHHAITPYKSVGAITEHLTRIARNLPPVTPEQNLDEWCADCKEYDHENRCCPRWTQVIRQTRRELQDEFVMTAVDGTLWVTVDDVQKVGRVIVDEEKR